MVKVSNSEGNHSMLHFGEGWEAGEIPEYKNDEYDFGEREFYLQLGLITRNQIRSLCVK